MEEVTEGSGVSGKRRKEEIGEKSGFSGVGRKSKWLRKVELLVETVRTSG